MDKVTKLAGCLTLPEQRCRPALSLLCAVAPGDARYQAQVLAEWFALTKLFMSRHAVTTLRDDVPVCLTRMPLALEEDRVEVSTRTYYY